MNTSTYYPVTSTLLALALFIYIVYAMFGYGPIEFAEKTSKCLLLTYAVIALMAIFTPLKVIGGYLLKVVYRRFDEILKKPRK